MATNPTINLTLRRKINNVLTDLMVKTISDQVYIDERTTLTMELQNLIRMINLKANQADFSELERKFNDLIEDAPETLDTLREIGEYIDAHREEFEVLISLVDNKVDKIEGKGLSTNDFTNTLKERLETLYSNPEIDAMFSNVSNQFDSVTATINAHSQTLSEHQAAIEALRRDVDTVQDADDLIGGFHTVETIKDRDALLTDATLTKPGMVCYVHEDGVTYQLTKALTWVIYTLPLTQPQLELIHQYIEEHLADRCVFETIDGVNYLTLR